MGTFFSKKKTRASEYIRVQFQFFVMAAHDFTSQTMEVKVNIKAFYFTRTNT